MSTIDRSYSEKRDFIRMHVDSQAVLKVGDASFEARCVDLSSTGFQIEAATSLQVGDKVTMLLAQAQTTPAGMLPRMRSFTVSGLFRSGHAEFDAGMAFVSLGDAEKMERLSAPAGLRLRIADMHSAPQVAAELEKSMPGYLEMRDWSKLIAVWFGAVQTEK